MSVHRVGFGFPSLLLLAAGWLAPPTATAQDDKKQKTESRKQAVLQIAGKYLPDRGGLELTESATEGPAANLELPGRTNLVTRLDKGDIITEVDGKKFSDRREFLDLLNTAYATNKGEVRIKVKDVKSGDSEVFVARPVVVQMDVPVAKLDFLAELGKPVPAAPDVPLVPATIDR